MYKRLHAVVFGKVQGVGYRAFIYDKALSLGLKGFVKNLPDGTVEIEAEGDEIYLFQLLDKAKKGTPLTNVTNVDFKIYDDLKGYTTFKIAY
ncbi:acylphosphatase [Deferribacter autotrophicus]|uniref:acylphosphatase n=1 Tax=Deferribacter autotrophicus TaxID=500465 RepID=A0A5A8F3A7_9BACT|nr:acylphosphatase [Deferribacter autotrophicus]KAA0258011.1 acylphosphatase [Deferribacter autotrophicus]